MQPTFKYVEDYLEFICGYDVNNTGPFPIRTDPPVSLARYDVKIVESLCHQTLVERRAYTDKQYALAVKLISKYKRQLAGKGITLPDTLDNLRLGTRKIDTTRRVFIKDQKIVIKSPYDEALIQKVQDLKNKDLLYRQQVSFDSETRAWALSMTEFMLNWAVNVAPAHNLEVSAEVQALYDQMLAVEQAGYEIQLKLIGEELVITNAESSLLSYVEENLGGLNIDNLLALVDNAPVLGYSVSDELMEAFVRLYGLDKKYTKRIIKVKRYSDNLEEILAYARQVNRLPVYIYQPGLDDKIASDEVVYLDGKTRATVNPKLLVSTTSLMIGPKRQSWFNNAEKIIILEG